MDQIEHEPPVAAPARRTVWVTFFAATLLIVGVLAAPNWRNADESADDGAPRAAPVAILGAIDDVVIRDGRATLVGWVDTTDRALTIEFTTDDTTGLVELPDQLATRPDVASAFGLALPPRGFSLDVGPSLPDVACVGLVQGGVTTPIDCWTSDPDTRIAAPGTGPTLGTTGTVRRFSVEVEAATNLHPSSVAAVVESILGDDRSWVGGGDVRFRRTQVADADIKILVATPATVDALCAPLRTLGQLSCRSGDMVILNLDRWNGAVTHWSATLSAYRAYLVNHEVGHALGFGHRSCPGSGRLAPVMQQQTKALNGCRPNGWPFPSNN